FQLAGGDQILDDGFTYGPFGGCHHWSVALASGSASTRGPPRTSARNGSLLVCHWSTVANTGFTSRRNSLDACSSASKTGLRSARDMGASLMMRTSTSRGWGPSTPVARAAQDPKNKGAGHSGAVAQCRGDDSWRALHNGQQ